MDVRYIFMIVTLFGLSSIGLLYTGIILTLTGFYEPILISKLFISSGIFAVGAFIIGLVPIADFFIEEAQKNKA